MACAFGVRGALGRQVLVLRFFSWYQLLADVARGEAWNHAACECVLLREWLVPTMWQSHARLMFGYVDSWHVFMCGGMCVRLCVTCLMYGTAQAQVVTLMCKALQPRAHANACL